MENYYKDQLGKLVLDKTYAPQIKITSLNTETKWLELNEESASEIRNWLGKNYPTKEREVPLKQRIILKLYELSESDLVRVNNVIAANFEWHDFGIYLNTEREPESTLKWYRVGKWEEFETFEKMSVNQLTQIAGEVPDYIENHFDQFNHILKL